MNNFIFQYLRKMLLINFITSLKKNEEVFKIKLILFSSIMPYLMFVYLTIRINLSKVSMGNKAFFVIYLWLNFFKYIKFACYFQPYGS